MLAATGSASAPPANGALEDDAVLESIERSFTKFHAFLDLLRDAGCVTLKTRHYATHLQLCLIHFLYIPILLFLRALKFCTYTGVWWSRATASTTVMVFDFCLSLELLTNSRVFVSAPVYSRVEKSTLCSLNRVSL